MDKFLGFLDTIEDTNKELVKTCKQAYLECVYEPKPRSYGAGILFVCKATHRILLLLRSPNEEDPNVWCGLGGKGELGESPMQTAKREVWEEGQITPDQYNLIKTPLRVNKNTPKFRFITYLGIVEQEFQPTINHEHVAARWFDLSEISQIPLHYGISAIINDQKNMEFINKYLE
jgi:8-oxo-dGTP pyrophosphatase MutT (NUDIX family)